MIPWTVALQAPPSIGFSRRGDWSGLPFPSLEDLPDPGIKPGSPALQADFSPIELQGVKEFLSITLAQSLKSQIVPQDECKRGQCSAHLFRFLPRQVLLQLCVVVYDLPVSKEHTSFVIAFTVLSFIY